MTANFNLVQNIPVVKRHWTENLQLYSLFFLVMLLVAVFTFWKPRGEGYYSKQFETSEAAGDISRGKSSTESQYRSIITNGDAIRSVFQ